jgi:hypothetical protein
VCGSEVCACDRDSFAPRVLSDEGTHTVAKAMQSLWGGGLSLRSASARTWRASDEWTVTLVADTEPGPVCEQPVAYLE